MILQLYTGTSNVYCINMFGRKSFLQEGVNTENLPYSQCETYIGNNPKSLPAIAVIGIPPDIWQSKTVILSTNVDQKLLETEFLIAICRPTGDKQQSKALFLTFVDIVKSFDCCLSDVGNHLMI